MEPELPGAHYGAYGTDAGDPGLHDDECQCPQCQDDDEHDQDDGSVQAMLGFHPSELDHTNPWSGHHTTNESKKEKEEK